MGGFKKFINDLGFNFLGSLLITLSLQVMIFPKISAEYSTIFFGGFLFVIGLINLLGGSVGATANALYLKNYVSFKENNNKEDGFRYILTISLLSLLLLTIFIFDGGNIFSFNNEFFYENISIFFILVFLLLLRIYLTTWLRAELQYKKILLTNLSLVIGYFTVYFLIGIYDNPFLLLIVPEFFFIITFFLLERNLLLIVPKLTFEKRIISKILIKGFIILFFSSLFMTLFKYIDRFFIDSYLRTELISIFYAGNITSQLFMYPFTVLSGVIFSYFIQSNIVSGKKIKFMLFLLPISAACIYFISILIAPSILMYIYPDYYEDSINIFYVTSIGQSILIIDVVLRGFVIKFFNEIHKLIIDAVTLIVGIGLMILLVERYELIGVAWSLTIALTFKAVINYIYLIVYYLKRKIKIQV